MKTKHMITLSMALLSTSFLSAWEVTTHRAIDRCAITKECGRDGAKNLAWFGDTMIAYNEDYVDEKYEGYTYKDNGKVNTYTYFNFVRLGEEALTKWGQTFSSYFFRDLIEAGSILEDSSWADADIVAFGGDGRFNNHFIDPQHKNKGLTLGYGDRVDLITWAENGDKFVFGTVFDSRTNNYSYNKFLEYYKKGFTEANSTIRKTNRANMFVSVGFLLHLLNDINVPAHVRDDGHPTSDPFEKWMRGGEYGADKGGFRVEGLFLSKKNDEKIKKLSTSDKIWKTNETTFKDFYQKEADFTSYNFFSEDTILHNKYVPKKNDVDIGTKYITVKGKQDKLAIKLSSPLLLKLSSNGSLGNSMFTMQVDGDNSVLVDNGKHLIPRAVANAEGFVNFLFRGRMKADIVDNSKLYIENFSDPSLVAKDNTDFNNGTFSIYYDTNSGSRKLLKTVSLSKSMNVAVKDGLVTSRERISVDISNELKEITDLGKNKEITILFDGTIGSERGLSVAKAKFRNYKDDTDKDGFYDGFELLKGTDLENKTQYPKDANLTAPTSLKTTALNDKSIKLSWDSVPNNTDYKICSSATPIADINNCTASGGTLTSAQNNFIQFSNLVAGKTYYFRAMATSSESGLSSPQSDEVTGVPEVVNLTEGAFSDPQIETEYNVKKVGLDTSTGTLKLALAGDTQVDTTFPFIWIANSGEGTISKLDTRTGNELGRYRTSEGNGNPSRTTVDKEGNVWVGNRNNNTISKIGLSEWGQCIDRNKNGVIDTSHGANDIKNWGEEECLLLHKALTYNGVDTPIDIRLVAIDKDNNVFAGGYNRTSLYKVNGATGDIIGAVNTLQGHYGGVVDKYGNLWSMQTGSGKVQKITNDMSTKELISLGHNGYGIAIDKYGKIWTTEYGSRFSTFDPANPTASLKVFYQTNSSAAQGIACDGNGDIFIAGSLSQSLVGHYKQRFSADGTFEGVDFVTNYTVGQGATGVAVDSQGKVWSANYYANSASRIDPITGEVINFPVGTTPYNYSDMTGNVIRNITTRQGTWEAVFDGKELNFLWNQVTWKLKQALPAGTTAKVFVKVSNSNNDWGSLPYVEVANGAKLSNSSGQYAKLKVELSSENLTDTPEVIEILLH